MNIRKHRILFLLFAIILAVGPIPVQAFADDAYDRPGKSIAEYQAVLDRLNEEYGVESYITDQEMVDQITANLINSYGYLPFTPRVVTLEVLQQCTLKEFEAEVIANFNGYSIMAQRAGSDQPAELESGSRQDSGIISPAPNRGYYWAYIISPNPYGETSQLAATKDGNGKFNTFTSAAYYGNPQYDPFGQPYNYFTLTSWAKPVVLGGTTLTLNMTGLDVGYYITRVDYRDCTYK